MHRSSFFNTLSSNYRGNTTNFYINIIGFLSLLFYNGCSCDPKTNQDVDKTGVLSITVDKNTLQDNLGAVEHQVLLSLQLADGAKPEVVGAVQKFRIRCKLEAEGGIPGSSQVAFLAYNEEGFGKNTILTDGAEKVEPVFYFFKTTEEGIIEPTEKLSSSFILNPGLEVNKLKLTFELLDDKNSAVEPPCIVNWSVGTRFFLKIDPASLAVAPKVGFVKNNKFTVTIHKLGKDGVPADLLAADLASLSLIADRLSGQGSLKGGNVKKLDGGSGTTLIAATAGAKGYATLDLQAIGGAEDTELRLSLQPASNAKSIVVKIPALPNVKIEIEPTSKAILQGNNELVVDLKITALSDLKREDLHNIKLVYETAAIPTTSKSILAYHRQYQSVDIQGASLYEMLGSHVEEILSNATETINVTLVPDNANSLTFSNIRLKGSASESTPGCFIPTIKWSKPSVKMELADPATVKYYGSSQQIIQFSIDATAELSYADAQLVKLDYKFEPAVANVGLWYKKPDNTWEDIKDKDLATVLNLDLNKALPSAKHALPLKVVFADPTKTTNVVFTDIALKGVLSEEKKLIVQWYKPSVTLKINNSQFEYRGYGEREIIFDVKAEEVDLSVEDLQDVKLGYDTNADTGNATLQYSSDGGTNWQDAKDVDLNTLLGINSLAAKATQQLILRFEPDPAIKNKIGFNNIRLNNSERPDGLSVTWQRPDIKINPLTTTESTVYGFNLGTDATDFAKSINMMFEVGTQPLTQEDLAELNLTLDPDIIGGTADVSIKRGAAEILYTVSIPLTNLLNPSEVGAGAKIPCEFIIKPTQLSTTSVNLKDIKLENAWEDTKMGRYIPSIVWHRPAIQLSLSNPKNATCKMGYHEPGVEQIDDMKDGVSLSITGSINHNAITEQDLKSATIAYTGTNFTLNRGNGDINNKSLYDLLNTGNGDPIQGIKKSTAIEGLIHIDSGLSTSIDIEDLHLEGVYDSKNVAKISWRAPQIKLALKDKAHINVVGYEEAEGSTMVPCEVTVTKADYTVTKYDLKKITLSCNLNTPGAALQYKDKHGTLKDIVSGTTTLYDLLGQGIKAIAGNNSQEFAFYIKPAGHTELKINNVKLNNVTTAVKDAEVIPNISWSAPDVNLKVHGNIHTANKSNPLTLQITANNALSKKDLEKITLNFINELEGLKTSTGNSVTSGMNLHDLLGKSIPIINKGQVVNIVLTSSSAGSIQDLRLTHISNTNALLTLRWAD